jgi:hypothetical protein
VWSTYVATTVQVLRTSTGDVAEAAPGVTGPAGTLVVVDTGDVVDVSDGASVACGLDEVHAAAASATNATTAAAAELRIVRWSHVRSQDWRTTP